MLTFNQHTKENSDISLIDILNEYASCETIHCQTSVRFLHVANKIWHDSFKCVQYMFIRLYSEKKENYFNIDGNHLNNEGHEVVADELYMSIKSFLWGTSFGETQDEFVSVLTPLDAN